MSMTSLRKKWKAAPYVIIISPGTNAEGEQGFLAHVPRFLDKTPLCWARNYSECEDRAKTYFTMYEKLKGKEYIIRHESNPYNTMPV